MHILNGKRSLCVYERPWGGKLKGNVLVLCTLFNVHLRLRKAYIVDLLSVLIELFSVGVTAEVLQANIDWKSAFLKGVGQFYANVHAEGNIPHKSFLRRGQSMPYNFAADSIHTK